MDRHIETKNESGNEARSRSASGELSLDSVTVGVSTFKNETLVLMPELVTSENGEQLRIVVRMAKSTIRYPVAHITGRSEGDHVTAYVAILELLCAAIEGEDAHDIPERIVEIIRCVFDSEEIKQKFDKQLENFHKFKEQHFLRNDRKVLTHNDRKLAKAFQKYKQLQQEYKSEKDSFMQTILTRLSDIFPNDLIMTTNNLCSDKSIEKQKKTLKRGEISLPMEAIQRIGDTFLAEIQSLPDVAFPKPRIKQSGKSADEESKEPQAHERRTEGSRVQRGIYGLTALNRLLKVRKDIAVIQAEEKKEDNEYIEPIKEAVLNFVCDLVEPGSKIATGLRTLVRCSITEEELKGHQCQRHKACQTGEGKKDHIVEEMFDDQFLEQLDATKSYEENRETLLTLCGFITGSVDPNARFLGRDNLVTQVTGELFEDLFDFKFNVHGNTDSPKEILAKVTARHIVIMFTAFNQLKHLSPEISELIIYSFIEHGVLQTEGWRDFRIESLEKNITLNKEELMNMLLDEAILGNKDNSFRMLTQSEKDQGELTAATTDESVISYKPQ